MHGDLYDLAVANKSASKKPFPPTPAASPASGFLAPLSSMTKSRAANSGLPDHVVLRYMRQLTSALVACHRSGVYHRDLKPENVLLAGALDASGYPLEAKLADFGLATRETFSTELGLGTRAYLAPECLDEAIDGYLSAPADVFALALVAVQVAHPGVRLWSATETSDLAWTQFTNAVRDARAGRRRSLSGTALSPALTHFFDRHAPQLSEPVRALIVRACDPDPQHRASLTQFAQLLESVTSWKCHRTPALLAVAWHDSPVKPASPAKPLGAPACQDDDDDEARVLALQAATRRRSRHRVDWSSLDDDDDDDKDVGLGSSLASQLAAMSFKVTPATPTAAAPAAAKVTVDKARQESLDSALGNSLPAVPQVHAMGKYVPPSKRTAQYASPVMTRIGGFLAPPARK
ncbi:serine/threonine protein kinase [Allomyces macrogynus ATCC 38327]|uniref:Serine/threonine protein kinase n=1 Tax=Allomyces macrogynus (strain ATCC 38327) TaxID=578462 RepID=A0A0L0T0I4_ALLM3|nr:serine/threonine protein kinase [Allomyces macrogynus ATCC 38327]|eukprot:KNE68298.1 serine/threonine protein kinase [Allomyces macrogynus ATCC 38327]